MTLSNKDILAGTSLLFKSDNTLIYKAKGDDSSEIIIKTNLDNEQGFRRISRLLNEHQILLDYFPEYESRIVREPDGRTLIMRRAFSGSDLLQWIRENQFDLDKYLTVFLSIAKALRKVHEKDVIHRDISPVNIIVSENLEATVIDFDLSTVIDASARLSGNEEQIEGNLKYISPEQTGRINRTVDIRTDLYALGATAYHLFTGRAPFLAETASELIHAQIARMAEPAGNVNPQVPVVVSDIIACLMSKDPEDRYQSAEGLVRDIEECMRQLRENGSVEAFLLRRFDAFTSLHISENLYGREKDLEKLQLGVREMFEANAKLVLISGQSGVGKTSLVNELLYGFSNNDCFYLSGKFENLNKHIPYSAWLSICRDLIHDLMGLPAAELDMVRSALKRDLGDEAMVLTAVIPQLNILLGDLPAVAHAEGQESQNRFIYQVVTFVKTLASFRPMVLFLDDVQWSDSASIELLKHIFEGCYSSKIMLMCSYRDNEVDDSHPFMVKLDELKKELGVRPLEVHLGNLSVQHVQQMIVDTFTNVENPEALAGLVHDRTQGNSFIVKQFLGRIFDDGLIQFNYNHSRWEWNSERISHLILSNDIADILSNKLNELTPESQFQMQIAACIGASFSLNTLSTVSEKNRNEVLHALLEPIKSGLIAPSDYRFRYLPVLLEDTAYDPVFVFCHDRIQQSAYDRLNESEKQITHSRIAQLLSETLSDEEKKERLFELVNHLNNGNEPVAAEERHKLMILNYQAGLRSMLSVANIQAVHFLQQAYMLLPPDAHNVDYHEWLRISEKLAEAASYAGKADLMEWHSDMIAKYALTASDKMKMYESRITYYFNNMAHSKSADIAIEALQLLGVKFPAKVSKLTIILEVIKTKMVLTSGKIKKISEFPHMSKPDQLQIMRVSRAALPAFLSARTELYPLLICDMVRRSVKHGNCAPSIAAYGSYSIVVAGILGEIDSGTTIALKMKELVGQFNESVYKATAEFIYNFFILHWKKPLRNAVSGLKNGYVSGLLSGNTQEGVYCFYIQQYFGYSLDNKLKDAREGFSQVIDVCRQHHQTGIQKYAEMYLASVCTFENEKGFQSDFEYAGFNLSEYIEHCDKNKDSIGLGAFYLEWAYRELLFGRLESARGWIDKFHANRETMNGTPLFATFIFVQSLVLTLQGGVHSKKEKADEKILKANLALYKKWSGFAPENYAHRYQLMLAVAHWRKKQMLEAEKHFELAIESGVRSEMLRELAYTYEIAAEFFNSHGNHVQAERMQHQAWMNYSSWGALSKTNQIASSVQAATHSYGSLNTTGSTSGTQIDLETILRSARTISSEIVLENLIEKMLRLVLENGGARTGYFITKQGADWIVNDRVGFDDVSPFHSVKLDDCDFLPLSIIRYAINSHENVVINEPSDLQRFRQDAYFEGRTPKSLLCMPFAHQGVINSVVFLENDLAYESFTQSRMKVLNLLSGQIAVSVGNAQLYANLEEKVFERTAELNAEKAKSEELLLNILPEFVADELKTEGKSRARKYDNAAVLFSDFVNFTTVAEQLEPEELVSALGSYYEAFDRIVDKLGIEKIKTVGDSYLCAAGLPVPVSNPSELIIRAAQEFILITHTINKERQALGLPVFEIRVGINTGPVVAGVVGIKKFAYDIWGDTVNTAARMEQSSSPGRINISGSTYEQVKNVFQFEHRGKIHAKNKGEIDMYYVALPAAQVK